MASARISLTLSCHPFLSSIASGRSSKLHPVLAQSCCMLVLAGCPAFARPSEGVHWSMSLMSSSLLLQQCPACLVCLTMIVFVMGNIYIYIYLIIMLCRQHGYPWPFLITSSYHSSPLAGLQGYIPYPHRAAICIFELTVLLLLSHMWGSIGVHHLWARPCFSSSILHVWFIYLG